ncbi:MAG: hypothetical protein ACKVOB_13310 [Sphingomonas sp.]
MAVGSKTKRAKKAEPAAPVITSIKGFDSNLACRGYQFEVGKTYEHDGLVQACASGFHACTTDAHPLEVFSHYPPAGARYCLVTQGGETNTDDGLKIASAKITIDVEISIGDLVKRAWDYVWSRSDKSTDSSATGERGAASATGEQGAASATGWQGAAMSIGYLGRVMGADGNALFCVERDRWDGPILSAAHGIVGTDGIVAGTWYTCQDGKLVEAAQ